MRSNDETCGGAVGGGDAGGEWPVDAEQTGGIVVDHGPRRDESNRMLEQFVATFAAQAPYGIVEPAHMELAEPSIATAFDRCVAAGARRVVVCPYFLLPGKHWFEDIPHLTAEAASRHPGIAFMVTAPIGLHPMMLDVIDQRIAHCLRHTGGKAPECEACAGMDICAFQVAGDGAGEGAGAGRVSKPSG